jgi:hypothetical protein
MKTVLEQALEALENCTYNGPKMSAAIAALKEVIAKQGEPVAVVNVQGGGKNPVVSWLHPEGLSAGSHKLYTSAPTIPEGWQLVPKELPHKIVLDLWRDGHVEPAFTWTATLNKLSKAMLSAAPKGEPDA